MSRFAYGYGYGYSTTALGSGTIAPTYDIGDASAGSALSETVTLGEGLVWPEGAQTVTIDPIGVSATLTPTGDTTATLTAAGWQGALAALLVGESLALTIRDAVAVNIGDPCVTSLENLVTRLAAANDAIFVEA